MKIIFIDIDGTLTPRVGSPGWDPDAVEALNYLTEKSGAKLVVSSEWRNTARRETNSKAEALAWLRAAFAKEGVTAEVLGVTPTLVKEIGTLFIAQPRRNEIAQWLRDHPDVTHWVVVDDNPDAGPTNLVQVGPGHGDCFDFVSARVALRYLGQWE